MFCPVVLLPFDRQRKSKIENFEETDMENKNIDNISDNAVTDDHTEMPVDGTATPVTPVEMAVGPDSPVRPSDSSATRSDYTHKRLVVVAIAPAIAVAATVVVIVVVVMLVVLGWTAHTSLLHHQLRVQHWSSRSPLLLQP